MMEFWVTVSSQGFGLLSAIVLYYAATDPKGEVRLANNQNPQIAKDARRRKFAARCGLALVALSFALQIAFTLTPRGQSSEFCASKKVPRPAIQPWLRPVEPLPGLTQAGRGPGPHGWSGTVVPKNGPRPT